MAEYERVVAIGLLTERDLTALGQGFARAFRLEEQHDFGALLTAIDQAERDYRTPAAPCQGEGMRIPPRRC